MVQQGTQTVTPPPTDPDMLSQPTVGQRAAAGAAPPPAAPPPSTPAAAPAASGPAKGGDEPDSKKYRLMAFIKSLSGGGTPAINASLEQHYARQRAQAQLAEQQVQQLANAYAAEKDPAKRQELAHQWEAAKENYLKVIGKDKNAKGIGQKTIGVLEKLVGHGGGGMTGSAAGAASPQGGGGGGAAPAASGGGGGAAPTQQGSQTVPPPPQLATAPKPTVPPPPGASSAPWQLDAMGAPERERTRLEEDARNLKDEEYRDKLKAESDPQYHVNPLKRDRDDIKSAFPDMADADIEKAVLTKAGVIPKGAGKEMQPDFKDGMLVGVKSPGTNEYYTDPKTMPPEAKAIYDSAKNVEKEHTNAEEAKENRREAAQARLAELHEKIHDREQELAQSSKIPLTVAGRASQAEIIKEQTADLRAKLADPELQKLMGPIAGRTTGAAARLYNSKVQDFFASQESLDALLPLLHGYRGGAQTHETFKKSMGSLTISPEAYKGTLDALDKLSDNVVDEVESEYPNAPMFKNKRDAASAKSYPRGKTVSAPPDGAAQRFTDGGKTYNIPSDKVAAFKKDHPNAR